MNSMTKSAYLFQPFTIKVEIKKNININKMTNQKKEVETKYQKADQIQKENQSVKNGQTISKTSEFETMEKDLNSKILELTMKIKDHYPELSKYLDEMPVTVPSEKDPEMTLNHLKTYYESLNSLLNKYKVDYPKIEE